MAVTRAIFEDIDRHHLHIVTLCGTNGQADSFIHAKTEHYARVGAAVRVAYRRAMQTQGAPRGGCGGKKRPVGNVLKGISGRYKFQTLGEYRALLSLYNVTVEECRGEVRGREYGGFVYSATDDRSEKGRHADQSLPLWQTVRVRSVRAVVRRE